MDNGSTKKQSNLPKDSKIDSNQVDISVKSIEQNMAPPIAGPEGKPSISSLINDKTKLDEEINSKIFANPLGGGESTGFNINMKNEKSADQTAISNMPATQVMMKKSAPKRGKIGLVLISVFVLLLLTVGGVSAYKGDFYWVRDILGLGMPSDPNKAIDRVSQSMAKVKSYKSSMTINLDMIADGEKLSGAITGNSQNDVTKKETKLDLKLGNINLPESAGVEGAEALKSMNIEANIITTEKEVYFKIPLLGNKWYKANIDSFANPVLSDKSKVDENAAKMAGAVVYSNNIENSGYGDLSKYIKSAEKLKDEKVNGVSSYHYKLTLDLVKVLETDPSMKDLPEFYKSMIKDMFNKYVKFNIDIFVAKKNFLILRESGQLSVNFDSKDFGGSGVFSANIKFQEDLKDIDLPITIDKPKDTVEFNENTLMELIGPLVGGSIPSTSALEVRDAKRKADLAQLRTAVEQYAVDNNGKFPIANTDSRNSNFMKDASKYLNNIPKDPLAPKYYYKYESDGKTYKLTCVLENANDTSGKKVGGLNIYELND